MRTPKLSHHKSARNWLPVPTVARRLGLSVHRVLDLIRTRALDAKLVGGARWFVSADEIMDYRRAHRQERRAA